MIRWLETRFPSARWLVIMWPYLWMLLFFAVPFAIVLKISFAESQVAQPPYTDLIRTEAQRILIALDFKNYQALLLNDKYFGAYLSSLWIAGTSTLICLLIGYPMAYCIARLPPTTRNLALMLVVMPSWTSFLIRIYAWIGLLKNNGVINNVLLGLGIIDEPLKIMHTTLATHIGIVYAYLPFMVLPLYANLVKHDPRLLEAAYDLGQRPFAAFFKVTIPLSWSGIIAGCMLVFIPAVGEFVIPELLGGPDTKMIGKLLWEEYFIANDWPRASAIAISMLVILMVPIMVFNHFKSRNMESSL